MNIYRQKFTAVCPNNGRHVDYVLTIESNQTLMVETIQAATKELNGFHEVFADSFFAQFGGRQTLTAHHHGTDIETVRP